MNDHGVHSHNSLRAMYYFAGVMDACHQIEEGIKEGVTDPIVTMTIADMRNSARDQLASAAYTAIVGGMIEQGDGYGH